MKTSVSRLWPKSQQKLADYAKEAADYAKEAADYAKETEEREVSLLKEHPQLLALLAVGFLFGFGFLFAAGYFIYGWFKNRG